MVGYGSLEDGLQDQPATAGGSRLSNRKFAGLLLVLSCALVLASYVTLQQNGVLGVELVVRPPKSEGKVVDAAEDATISFASHDVTAAALKAQQEARATYEKMMSAALKAEAKAHKDGEKATAKSLQLDVTREHRKMEMQQQRAMRDEMLQEQEDAKEYSRIDHELDRSLGSKVLRGQ